MNDTSNSTSENRRIQFVDSGVTRLSTAWNILRCMNPRAIFLTVDQQAVIHGKPEGI